MKEFTITRTLTIDFRALEGTDFHVICYSSTEDKAKSYEFISTKHRKKIENARNFNKSLLKRYRTTPTFIQNLIESNKQTKFKAKGYKASLSVVSKDVLALPKTFGYIYLCGPDNKNAHMSAKMVYKNGIPETHELVLYNEGSGLLFDLDGAPLKYDVLETICMDDYDVQSYMDAVAEGRMSRLPYDRLSDYYKAVFPMTEYTFSEYLKTCITHDTYTALDIIRKSFDVELIEKPYTPVDNY